MNNTFELLGGLNDKIFITDLTLCRVLMEDSVIPWIFLVPMRNNISQINQLSASDKVILMNELDGAAIVMEKFFETDRLNIAAIGNKTPQLHIHVISRTINDQLWPETVWGKKIEKLSSDQKDERSQSLQKGFCKYDI